MAYHTWSKKTQRSICKLALEYYKQTPKEEFQIEKNVQYVCKELSKKGIEKSPEDIAEYLDKGFRGEKNRERKLKPNNKKSKREIKTKLPVEIQQQQQQIQQPTEITDLPRCNPVHDNPVKDELDEIKIDETSLKKNKSSKEKSVDKCERKNKQDTFTRTPATFTPKNKIFKFFDSSSDDSLPNFSTVVVRAEVHVSKEQHSISSSDDLNTDNENKSIKKNVTDRDDPTAKFPDIQSDNVDNAKLTCTDSPTNLSKTNSKKSSQNSVAPKTIATPSKCIENGNIVDESDKNDEATIPTKVHDRAILHKSKETAANRNTVASVSDGNTKPVSRSNEHDENDKATDSSKICTESDVQKPLQARVTRKSSALYVSTEANKSNVGGKSTNKDKTSVTCKINSKCDIQNTVQTTDFGKTSITMRNTLASETTKTDIVGNNSDNQSDNEKSAQTRKNIKPSVQTSKSNNDTETKNTDMDCKEITKSVKASDSSKTNSQSKVQKPVQSGSIRLSILENDPDSVEFGVSSKNDKIESENKQKDPSSGEKNKKLTPTDPFKISTQSDVNKSLQSRATRKSSVLSSSSVAYTDTSKSDISCNDTDKSEKATNDSKINNNNEVQRIVQNRTTRKSSANPSDSVDISCNDSGKSENSTNDTTINNNNEVQKPVQKRTTRKSSSYPSDPATDLPSNDSGKTEKTTNDSKINNKNDHQRSVQSRITRKSSVNLSDSVSDVSCNDYGKTEKTTNDSNPNNINDIQKPVQNRTTRKLSANPSNSVDTASNDTNKNEKALNDSIININDDVQKPVQNRTTRKSSSNPSDSPTDVSFNDSGKIEQAINDSKIENKNDDHNRTTRKSSANPNDSVDGTDISCNDSGKTEKAVSDAKINKNENDNQKPVQNRTTRKPPANPSDSVTGIICIHSDKNVKTTNTSETNNKNDVQKPIQTRTTRSSANPKDSVTDNSCKDSVKSETTTNASKINTKSDARKPVQTRTTRSSSNTSASVSTNSENSSTLPKISNISTIKSMKQEGLGCASTTDNVLNTAEALQIHLQLLSPELLKKTVNQPSVNDGPLMTAGDDTMKIEVLKQETIKQETKKIKREKTTKIVSENRKAYLRDRKKKYQQKKRMELKMQQMQQHEGFVPIHSVQNPRPISTFYVAAPRWHRPSHVPRPPNVPLQPHAPRAHHSPQLRPRFPPTPETPLGWGHCSDWNYNQFHAPPPIRTLQYSYNSPLQNRNLIYVNPIRRVINRAEEKEVAPESPSVCSDPFDPRNLMVTGQPSSDESLSISSFAPQKCPELTDSKDPNLQSASDYYASERRNSDPDPDPVPFKKIKLTKPESPTISTDVTPTKITPQTPPPCSFDDILPIMEPEISDLVSPFSSSAENQSDHSSQLKISEAMGSTSQVSEPPGSDNLSHNILSSQATGSTSQVSEPPGSDDFSHNILSSQGSGGFCARSPPLTPGMVFPETPRSSSQTPVEVSAGDSNKDGTLVSGKFDKRLKKRLLVQDKRIRRIELDIKNIKYSIKNIERSICRIVPKSSKPAKK